MAYTKINWVNDITDLDADNMNHMEDGIKENDDKLNGTKPMGSIVVDDVKCKNMFGNYVVINGWIDGTTMRVNSTNGNRMAFIPCQPNTTYTVSRSVITSSFRVSDYTTIPSMTSSNVDYTIPTATKNDSGTVITYTTSSTAKYIIIHYANIGSDSSSTIESSLASIQLEVGSEATTFTPYRNFDNVNVVILYETPSTITAQSTITFGDISNYNSVEILYGQANGGFPNSMKIVPNIAIGKAISFTVDGAHANEGIIYYNSARYNLTSTSLTFVRVVQKEFKSDNTIATTTSTTPTNIAIYRIIGYK